MLAVKELDLGRIPAMSVQVAVSIVRQSSAADLSTQSRLSLTAARNSLKPIG